MIDEDRVVQPRSEFLADRHVADQHQDCVLAFDLAGVDAALNHDHGLVGFRGGFGREGAILGDNQRDHGAAFGRRADVHHLDEARSFLQPMRNFYGLGVGRRLVPAGFLAGGEQIRRRILGAGGERRGGLGGGRFGGGVRSDGVLREKEGEKGRSEHEVYGSVRDLKATGQIPATDVTGL